jgi:hypothetical protein
LELYFLGGELIMKRIFIALFVFIGSMFSVESAEPSMHDRAQMVLERLKRKRPEAVDTSGAASALVHPFVGGLRPRPLKRKRARRHKDGDSGSEADESSPEGFVSMPRPVMAFTEEDLRSFDEAYKAGMSTGRTGSSSERRCFCEFLGCEVPPSTPRGFCSFAFSKILALRGTFGIYDGLIFRANDEEEQLKISGVDEARRLEVLNERHQETLQKVLRVEEGLVYGKTGIFKAFYTAKEGGDVGLCELLVFLFEKWTEWVLSWKPAGRILGDKILALGERHNSKEMPLKDWYTEKLAMLKGELEKLNRAAS